MKVKGITIWEQYAEFIAIGVVALVFIVYVVFQLSDDANAVKVGGKTLGPDAVDVELQARADGLARRIQDDAPAPVELEMPEPMSNRFDAAIASSINPADSMCVQLAEPDAAIRSKVDTVGHRQARAFSAACRLEVELLAEPDDGR